MSSSLQAASPSASLSHPAVHEKKASSGIKTVRARAPKSRFNTWPSCLIHCLTSILPPYPPHTHTFTSFPPPIVSVSGCKWWELGAITYSKWEVITVRTDRWRRRHVEVWMEEGKEGFIFKPGDDQKKNKPTARPDSAVLLFIKHLSPLMTLSSYAFIWGRKLCWQREVLPHPLSCFCHRMSRTVHFLSAIYRNVFALAFALTCCINIVSGKESTVCVTLKDTTYYAHFKVHNRILGQY